jgi:UDP-N-acetylglucosamine 3-dehydrogenase
MPLRGAVIGLGQIGRIHARLLQSSERVEFAGAVDMAGDPVRHVHDPALVHESVEDLLAATRVDFAIVALPTIEHARTATRLAEEGVHVLVEKPLAETVVEAEELMAAVDRAGVHAAVGHVERFNPALLELRRRMNDGQLGEVFIITTERIGPFPERVRDIGVVKDLATHDLDLVRWLADAPIHSVAAQTSHKMGRDHEDLVSVTGKVSSGIVFNTLVDWVSPTKVRRTRVVGERGMLLADTLTADLTFFANGTLPTEWDRALQLRGVSEGDTVRYALRKREPLLVELETFCDYVEGDADAAVVTLRDGLEAVRCAEAVLASAQRGETVVIER